MGTEQVTSRERKYVTVPGLAKRWGVGEGKVRRDFIDSGELRAINLASKKSTRTRLVIDEADVIAFEARRSVYPKSAIKPIRRREDPNVIEFFS